VKPTTLIVIFLCVILWSGVLPADQKPAGKDHTAWWVWTHGDYTKTEGKNDSRVNRAFDVFQKVIHVADKTSSRLPKLVIVNTKLGLDVRCLDDGGVIINPKILDICYNEVESKIGDSRLAFMLGHELAHLSNDDDFLKKVAKEAGDIGDKQIGELAADIKGAMTAAMAGFDIHEIFRKRNNFLHLWSQISNTPYVVPKGNHPSLAKRVTFVRRQMEKVYKYSQLFHAGLILYHVGSFLDASSTFREFAKEYPSREVFNNIGACYLRLALDRIRTDYFDDFYLFRFCTAINYTTSAESLLPRGVTDYLKDEDIAGYLDNAERYLKLAVDRDKQNATCRYNLATVLILKREYARAQAICDEVLKLNPLDLSALNNKIVSFYHYGKSENLDTTQKCVTDLMNALKANSRHPELNYNLASLKEILNRKTGAKYYWKKYLAIPNLPHDNFYIYAFNKLHGKRPPDPAPFPKPKNLPRSPAGIDLGAEPQDLPKAWQDQRPQSFKVGKGEDHDRWYIDLKVIRHNNLRLLILDDMVEFIEQTLPKDTPTTPNQLLKNLGPPQRTIPFKTGRFNVYNHMGFTFTEINGKTHTYIWYEPH
jgi:tetratricopeptide (TPR) repeat protein